MREDARIGPRPEHLDRPALTRDEVFRLLGIPVHELESWLDGPQPLVAPEAREKLTFGEVLVVGFHQLGRLSAYELRRLTGGDTGLVAVPDELERRVEEGGYEPREDARAAIAEWRRFVETEDGWVVAFRPPRFDRVVALRGSEPGRAYVGDTPTTDVLQAVEAGEHEDEVAGRLGITPGEVRRALEWERRRRGEGADG